LPAGVNAQIRCDCDKDYIFLMNFTAASQDVDLGATYTDLLSATPLASRIRLEPYAVRILTA